VKLFVALREDAEVGAEAEAVDTELEGGAMAAEEALKERFEF
jgi:hypothetical protein